MEFSARRLIFAAAVALVTLVTVPARAANLYGYVKNSSGVGLSGFTVTLSGSSSGSTTTGSSGYYSFVVNSGTYTVTPSRTGYTFNPTSQTRTISASTQLSDFIATSSGTSFTISGYVKNSTGAGMSGVTVSLSGAGSGSTTSGSGGYYSFANRSNGTYYVTPSYTNWTFSPTQRTAVVSGASVSLSDFVGTQAPTTYTISGYVKNSTGAGMSGVTVTLTGAGSGSATSGSGGYYSFSNRPNGTYYVTPSYTNWTFSPTQRTAVVSGASVSLSDFVGTQSPTTYSISGYVKNSSGAGMNGVTVTLSGAGSGSTTSGSSGYYSFSNRANGTYYVTPSYTNWTFSPTQRTAVVSGAPVSLSDFVGTQSPTTFSISGYVKNSTGAGMSGVTVTLSGAGSGSTTTGSSGYYSFADRANGTYYVSPSYSNWTFNPTQRTAVVSGAPVSLSDFVGSQNPSTGSLTVTVQRIDGGVQAGAQVVRYSSGGSVVDTLVTNGSGQVSYSGIVLPTAYSFEAYYEGVNAFDSLGELWAGTTITVSSSPATLTLRRNYPYAKTLRVYRVSDNAEVTGTSVVSGTALRLEALVQNDTSAPLTTTAQLRADASRTSPYDLDQTAASQSIPGGSTRTFVANWSAPTVSTATQVYGAVKTSVVPGGKTDSWNWVSLVQVVPSTGTLTVTVQNADGSARSGVEVVRYANGSVVDTVVTNATGQVTYSGITLPTTYSFEAYFKGPNAFDSLGELWAGTTTTVNTSSATLTLRRNYPYAQTLRVYRVSDNADVTGQAVPSGTALRIDAIVRNDTANALSTTVQVRADASQTAPYDLDSTSAAQSIAGNSPRTFSANWTAPTVASTTRYHAAVKTTVSPGGKTDSWNWMTLIDVTGPSTVRERWTTAVLRGRTYTFFVHRSSADPALTDSSLRRWGRPVLGIEVEPAGLLTADEAYRLALVAENRLVLTEEAWDLSPRPGDWTVFDDLECRTNDDPSGCTGLRDEYCLLRATAADAARFNLVYYDGWTGAGGLDEPNERRRRWKEVLLQAALGADEMINSPDVKESREFAEFVGLVGEFVRDSDLTLAQLDLYRKITDGEMMQLIGDAQRGLDAKFADSARKIHKRRFLVTLDFKLRATNLGMGWAAEAVRAFVAKGMITASSFERLDLMERVLRQSGETDPEIFCAIADVRSELESLENSHWGFVDFVIGHGAASTASDYAVAYQDYFDVEIGRRAHGVIAEAIKKHFKDGGKKVLRFGSGAAIGAASVFNSVDGSIRAAQTASLRVTLMSYLDEWVRRPGLLNGHDIDLLDDARNVVILNQDLAAAQASHYLQMLDGSVYSIALLNPVEALNWLRSFGSTMQEVRAEMHERQSTWTGVRRDRVVSSYYFTTPEVNEALRRWLLAEAPVPLGQSVARLSVNGPSSVRVGTPVTILATVENIGAATGLSYFDISTSNNIAYLSVEPTHDLRRYDIGTPIYTSQGGQTAAVNRLHSFVWRSFPAATARNYRITFTPVDTGSYWLRLRVSLGHSTAADGYARYPSSGPTDQQGWYVIEVPVAVTANQAPVIHSASPSETAITIASGASRPFSVSANDAENDALSVNWFLNDTRIAGGTAFTLAAASYPSGTYPLDVVVSDGQSVAVRTWTVTLGNQCQTPAAPALSGPSSVAGSAPYSLSWSSGCAECSYEVQESASPDFGGATTSSESGLVHSFEHALANAATFYYRVAAVRVCGDARSISPWSNVVSVNVGASCGTPATPVIASSSAEAVNGSTYHISWPTGGTGVEYLIEESADGTFGNAAQQVTTAGTAMYSHVVAVATTFSYRAFARRMCGGTTLTSGASNVVTTVVRPGFEISVQKNGSGTGTITSSPAGIDCGNTCSASFASNAIVNLTAVPASGSVFIGWSGACTGAASCSFSVTAPVAVQAQFAPALAIPANVLATATSPTQVSVFWAPVSGASEYHVFRMGAGSGWVWAGTVNAPPFVDAGRTAAAAYVYKVRAAAGPATSAFSLVDIATTFQFLEDPAQPFVTPIRGRDVTDLRSAVNALRSAAGLAAFTFTDPQLAGVTVKAAHLSELRTALAFARVSLGMPTITFTNEVLQGGTIRAVDLNEIRNGVK